jgi:hypothetical protein
MTCQLAKQAPGDEISEGDVLPQRVEKKTPQNAQNSKHPQKRRKRGKNKDSDAATRRGVVLELAQRGALFVRDIPAMTGWDYRMSYRTANDLVMRRVLAWSRRGVLCLRGLEGCVLPIVPITREGSRWMAPGSLVPDAIRANANSVFDLPRLHDPKLAAFRVLDEGEEIE